MTTHSSGRVDTYNSSTGQLTCKPGSIWVSGRVRTSGKVRNVCDPHAGTIDVTVTAATAAQLTHNFLFDLVYAERCPGKFRWFSRFAGQNLGPGATGQSGEGGAPSAAAE